MTLETCTVQSRAPEFVPLDLISRLPEELLTFIFSKLGMGDLAHCAQISRHFNTVSSDNYLWTRFSFEKLMGGRKLTEMDLSTISAKREIGTFMRMIFCPQGNVPSNFLPVLKTTAPVAWAKNYVGIGSLLPAPIMRVINSSISTDTKGRIALRVKDHRSNTTQTLVVVCTDDLGCPRLHLYRNLESGAGPFSGALTRDYVVRLMEGKPCGALTGYKPTDEFKETEPKTLNGKSAVELI